MTRESWREEFPCKVIHQGFPDGTTCLECRQYAFINGGFHLFTPEFRQRYVDYDRTLFCDNCWSYVRLFYVPERVQF